MFSITQRSTKLKNGKSPIVIVVYGMSSKTKNRSQKIITLKTPACLKQQWNPEFKRYRKTVDDFKIYNAALKKIEEKCEKIKKTLLTQFKTPTIEEFVKRYKDETLNATINDTISVSQVYSKYRDTLKKEGRIATYRTMGDSLNAWKRFLQYYGAPSLPIKEVTLPILDQFTLQMKSIGNSPNTIGIRMRDLRTIINYARNTGVISKTVDYPFEHYSWKHTKGKVKPHDFLTKEEWNAFKGVTLEDTSLQFYRDVFIFMVHCFGINYRDLVTLTYSENVDMPNRIIKFNRKKTRAKVTEKISVFITQTMENIMDRHKTKTDRLFPLLSRYPKDPVKWQETYRYSLKKFNKKIKTIAHKAGITNSKKVTSYVARHTFATLMYYEDVPMHIISQSLGHTTEAETKNYLKTLDAYTVHDIIKDVL